MGIIKDICVSISGIACRLYNGSKQDDTPMGPKIKKYGISPIWQMYLHFSLRNEDDNSPSNFYLLFVTRHWVGCPITFHSKIFPMEKNTDTFETWHSELQKAQIAQMHILPQKISTKKMAQKWPKITQNGPKMTQNCPNWPKNDKKLPKWPKNDPKWPKN